MGPDSDSDMEETNSRDRYESSSVRECRSNESSCAECKCALAEDRVSDNKVPVFALEIES